MRRNPQLRALEPVLGLLGFLFLMPSAASAAGFGTPTMDGLLSVGDVGIYNAVEAADSDVDPPQGNAPMNLGQLWVANDANFWYFLFTVNDDIVTTNWGKYVLFIDTTNDANGGTTDPWGRNITVADPHKAEYTVRSWLDAQPYGPEDSQLWAWDGVAWNTTGSLDDAVVSAGPVSGLEWKIARTAIGDPSTIWCSIATTSGGGTDNAQDTINDPPEDWNATDWTTTAIVSNSTQVDVSTGTDTTAPIVTDGCVAFFQGSPSVTNRVDLTFDEPIDPTTSQNPANYTDLGGNTVASAILTGATTVRLTLGANYPFGQCQQISVANVQDVAGNAIVANGTTNVANFIIGQIYMQARMNLHMQADPDTTMLGDAVGWEGSFAPLTWDPQCDLPLSDVDGDSTYTDTVNFCIPCSTGTGGAEVLQIQYKFTHGFGTCEHYETGSNHFYTFDFSDSTSGLFGDGVDSLDIWWNDQAPTNFTNSAVDVVYRLQNAMTGTPFGATDGLAVAGSELPLSWNTAPPTQTMLDDGVAPDETAGDGIFSTRLTFPAGTLKDVQFKYLLQAAADTAFNFECAAPGPGGENNRNVFLNDSLFSTTTPIVLDVAYFNDCVGVTGVEDLIDAIKNGLLEPNRPNPVRNQTVIAYSLPEAGPVQLDIFDVRGRHVRNLVNEIRPEGRHSVVWNGRQASGVALPNGVYFYRLVVGESVESRKIVLMR
jgi:hypothetical protein